MEHRVFSYGTLRQADVQQSLYGRAVPTTTDSLPGFRLDWLTITDPIVIEASGSDRHPILRRAAPVAAENFQRAGVSDRIELVVGLAAESVRTLVDQQVEPFDLVIIDADKPSNPIHLEAAMALSRPGTVIIGDNVVRNGAVADPTSGPRPDEKFRRFATVAVLRSRFVDRISVTPRNTR
ncbi:MAG: hypothetical protein QM714_03625 [Nocardioides sp.]|uniref:hypothetical protein n=1 Tax=Nocardioides sp. TaxID=35761 RepID=UPI0039E41038